MWLLSFPLDNFFSMNLEYTNSKKYSAFPSSWKAGFSSHSESLLVPKDNGVDVSSSQAICKGSWCLRVAALEHTRSLYWAR